MTQDKASQIVDALRSDPALYEKMSAQEGAVWGKAFSDDRRNQTVVADQKAAAELGVKRDVIDLPAVLSKHSLRPVNGLSLACGGGRAERGLLEQGICENFHGIDIADDALAEAQKVAASRSLAITYEKADLNKVVLNENAYDLAVTQNCLHHVLQLEHLADQIYRSLRPGGVLWVHDYIGETQFQYEQKRLDIVNKLLLIVPERCLYDNVNQRVVRKITRREPGSLVSPFEAIRSEEIMPIFLEKFAILEKHESDGFLNMVCPTGTRENFLHSEETRALFEIMFLFDRLLLEHDILKPRAGMYLLRPKK